MSEFTNEELQADIEANANPQGLGVNEYGDVKELEVACALLAEGWLVFRNISCVGPIDVVAINPKTGQVRTIDVKSPVISSGLPRIRQELRENQKNIPKHTVELLTTWNGAVVDNAQLTKLYPERPTTNFTKLLFLAKKMLEQNLFEVELTDEVLADAGLNRKQLGNVMRGRKTDTHRYKRELKELGVQYVPGTCNAKPKLRRFSQ